MTTVALSQVPIQDFLINGAPALGGKLFVYSAGTTTKITTYTDSTGGTSQTNPIVMNARGEPQNASGGSVGIWIPLGTTYKLVFTSSTDTDPPTSPIWTVDNISSGAAETLATVAALEAQTGLSSGVIIVQGYSSAGDGGGADYAVTGATGPGPGLVESANGVWWQIISYPTNIYMFGAKGDGSTDDSSAFQAAQNFGGLCQVPPAKSGSYVINTAPTLGSTTNIGWLIDPAALFSGSGFFPFVPYNDTIKPVGPTYISRTTQPSNQSTIATAAFAISASQPTSEAGSTVGLYVEAQGSNSAGGNIFAANFSVLDQGSANGFVIAMELDVQSETASNVSNTEALRIVGAGTQNTGYGVQMLTQGTLLFNVGVNVSDATLGVMVNQSSNISTTDGFVVARASDTSPVGTAFRIANAAGTVNEFLLDVSGNLVTLGNVTSSILVASQPASGVPSGSLGIGSGTATSATAGTHGATPNQVAGYLIFYLGSTEIKVPYYAA